jgi:aspartate aminotransferase
VSGSAKDEPAGAQCRTPQAAFYLYPDFAQRRPELKALGVGSAEALADYLLDERGVSVLPGSALGTRRLISASGSLPASFTGKTDEQRWEALRSAQPWIADALTQLRDGLAPLR